MLNQPMQHREITTASTAQNTIPVTVEQVVVRREPVIKRRGHALIVPRHALVSDFALLCERAA